MESGSLDGKFYGPQAVCEADVKTDMDARGCDPCLLETNIFRRSPPLISAIRRRTQLLKNLSDTSGRTTLHKVTFTLLPLNAQVLGDILRRNHIMKIGFANMLNDTYQIAYYDIDK